MKQQLGGLHGATYDAVFRQPVSRDVGWRDVCSMLGLLGDVSEDADGRVRVTRNGQTLLLRTPPPWHARASVRQVLEVRGFLERSGAPSADAVPDGVHLLVVLGAPKARVYRVEMRGALPLRVSPYDPFGDGGHAGGARDDDADGDAARETLARILNGAEQVLLFAAGDDAPAALAGLTAHLKLRHTDVARRVVGSVVIEDELDRSADRLLAKVRGVYARFQ